MYDGFVHTTLGREEDGSTGTQPIHGSIHILIRYVLKYQHFPMLAFFTPLGRTLCISMMIEYAFSLYHIRSYNSPVLNPNTREIISLGMIFDQILRKN